MSLSPSFTNPTGKRALLYSFRKWLSDQIPPANAADFTYGFLQETDPSVMPRVEVSDFRFFDPGDSAFGGIIFPAAGAGQQTEGKFNRCMVEIDIYADQNQQADAEQVVYKIRDRLVYGLTNAGVSTAAGTLILPGIAVLDPANSNFDTGTVARLKTEEDNYLIENYFPPNADKPSIHQVQLIAKLEWFEMR